MSHVDFAVRPTFSRAITPRSARSRSSPSASLGLAVLTLLRILERKGHVSHRKDGRAFIFLPTIDRSHARKNALTTLVNRFFEGSPGLLVLNLLEDEQLSADALKEIQKRIEEGR